MNIISTKIPGVFIIEPSVFKDTRGYFFESFSQRKFDLEISSAVFRACSDGINNPQYADASIIFVQDNESRSSYGVLRGLHFQSPPHAQGKLVRCVVGSVLDVAVDIRKGSPTYGKYVSVNLTEDNHRMLFLPRGMAHGFSVLSEDVIFQYKCDQFYAPQSEGTIAWNDPELAIDWCLPPEKVILSHKDSSLSLFKDFDSPFIY
ncbi:MAG TPA: dTDP-4-dehydrorhamnose 3,5-epimerase [Bacteroidaceae bacterium]|nr:dTDP-4-dehydrorhamnose 3,5-epimerase [Bacteroidaceae bacterium]